MKLFVRIFSIIGGVAVAVTSNISLMIHEDDYGQLCHFCRIRDFYTGLAQSVLIDVLIIGCIIFIFWAGNQEVFKEE